MRDTRDISTLKNWDKNPRSIKEKDFDRLKKQIFTLGQYKPLLITEDGTVLGGNMRLRAYRELNIKDIWVSVVDAPDEDRKLEYALSDNDRAGFYDADLLANLIPEYPDFDWSSYAVDMKEPQGLQELIDSFKEVEEDEPPLLSEGEPESKLGEVYQLGRHRLMCGDATNIDNVKTLLDGVQPTMIFTDPPYGVDYQSRVDEERRKGWGGIANDELKGAELQKFLKDSVGIYGQTKYICCNWQSVVDFWQAFGRPNAFIIWDKQSIGLGAGYRNQHEIILFYGKLDHNSETNVWGLRRDSTGKYTHPTQKPVALSVRAIKNSSNKGDVVLDMFGGSGSTLIAAEQTDRTCLMLELDPKYCDVIRKRYDNFIKRTDK